MEWEAQPKQAAVHTLEQQLTAIHENIIIGSPGFWRLASPDATALRSHFYLRVISVSAPGILAAPMSIDRSVLHAIILPCARTCQAAHSSTIDISC